MLQRRSVSCIYHSVNDKGHNSSPDGRFLLSFALPQDEEILEVRRSLQEHPTCFIGLNQNKANHFNPNNVTTIASSSQYNCTSNTVVL